MNPQGNKKSMNTAIAVVIAVVVVAFFLGGLIYHSDNAVVGAGQIISDQSTTSVNNGTSTANLNPTTLEVSDEVAGTGATAKAGDTVYVTYVGSLTNGQVFDQSADHAPGYFNFTLGAGQVIAGWDQGVAGMKVGGTRELVIPASLGYGNQAVGSIPANSTLVFVVKLLSIGAAPTPAQLQ